MLETYLITRLGYDWSTVHEEAERLEHAVSEQLVERMSFALGHPRYDPHGAPIPTADGTIEETAFVPLADVEVGRRARLRQVGDDDAERLRYLQSLGMVPMATLEVVDRQPFGGPVTVRVGERDTKDRVIGPELEASLYVEPRGMGWNRPVLASREAAENFLGDARNDYAVQWDRIETGLIQVDHPEFGAALRAWRERPRLPPPSGPWD